MFQKVIGQDKGAPASPPTPPPAAPTSAPSPASMAPPSAAASAPPSASRNVLSSDVEIKGTVKFDNDLVVDGKIEGEIHSKGSLTIGENALIKAEIKTKSVIIYGKCHGNVTVTDRVELKANAELVGDISAATLSIEPGAVFVGKSSVGTPKSAPSQPQQKQQPQPSHNRNGDSKKSNESTNKTSLKA